MGIPTREPRDEVFWVYCPTFESGVDTTTRLMQGIMMFVFRVWGSKFHLENYVKNGLEEPSLVLQACGPNHRAPTHPNSRNLYATFMLLGTKYGKGQVQGHGHAIF
jgi:hypothetical protein